MQRPGYARPLINVSLPDGIRGHAGSHGASAAMRPERLFWFNGRGKLMRMIVKGAMVAGLMALGACNNTPAENKADAIEANADAVADNMEEAADNMSNDAAADAMENKADAVEDAAENKADAIEANAAE